MQDALGRWYCCNDSYVTLSTLQKVLSEKAYILFFVRTSQRPVSVTNGVKPHETNGNSISKSPRISAPVKEMNMKSSNALSLVKGVTVASKSKDASGNLQNKFSGISITVAKKVSGCDNGITDIQKMEPVAINGKLVHSVSKQMNGNHTHSEEEKNGICRNGEQNEVLRSQVLVNGDGNLNNGTPHTVEGCTDQHTGLKRRETSGKILKNGITHNGHSNDNIDVTDSKRKSESRETAGKRLDNVVTHKSLTDMSISVSGSKRKLKDRDLCILLAKDAESRARVEEFKEVYVS